MRSVHSALLVFMHFFGYGHATKGWRQCCDPKTTITSTNLCSNNRTVNIKCNNTETLLNFDNQYEIHVDSFGIFLDAFDKDTVVREPHFCVATWKVLNHSPELTKNVAVVCGPPYWSPRPEVHIPSIFQSIFLYALIAFNSSSFFALLITAFLYSFLNILRDTHSTCAFHFSLNLGLLHGMFAYKLLFQSSFHSMETIMCITNVYFWGFVGLAAFCWSGILSYDTWKQSQVPVNVDIKKLMLRYRLCGYGIPAMLLILSSIHSYIDDNTGFNCYNHQNVLLLFYMLFPIVSVLFANFFFFVDTQRRFAVIYSLQPTPTLKKLRYRLYINVKLSFVMGVPWFLMMLCIPFSMTMRRLQGLVTFFYLLISFEGIIIFLVLVALRKRVLRGMANNNVFSCIWLPEKWKTLQASETIEESDNVETESRCEEHVSPQIERSFISIARELE